MWYKENSNLKKAKPVSQVFIELVTETCRGLLMGNSGGGGDAARNWLHH